MPVIIISAPPAKQFEKELLTLHNDLYDKVANPEAEFSVCDIVKVVSLFVSAAGIMADQEKRLTEMGLRLAAYEAGSSKAQPKPASNAGAALDQRLRATSDLLGATVERLDQIEEAVIRLHKPPFLKINPDDKPKKQLDALKASFDVVCVKSY